MGKETQKDTKNPSKQINQNQTYKRKQEKHNLLQTKTFNLKK